MNKHYDIVIVGGGMVGLACALALANSDLHIAVVESKAPESTFPKGYDLRVSAINNASIALFTELNVWHDIIQQRVNPYQTMHVWADNSHLDFSATEINAPELGFIIENRIIRQALWQRAAKTPNIELLCPTQLTSVALDTPVQITSEQGQFSCDLIIGADGANSWLRQQLAWPMQTDDYHHHALVTTVQTEKSHQQTAWQHFLPAGPLAFLPLADNKHCSVVWSSAPEHIAELKAMDSEDFNHAIGKAMQDTLGPVQTIAPRVSFPLRMQHLQDYVQDHIAFIGDAAHRIHPLAGQGVNLGFQDVACLAKLITKNQQKPYWQRRHLAAYQRERKYYNGQMIQLMQAIQRLFADGSPTLSSLRNITMDGLQKTPSLKNFLIQYAQGT